MNKLLRRIEIILGRTMWILAISGLLYIYPSHAWSFGGDKRIEKKWYSEQFRIFVHELNMSLSGKLLKEAERGQDLESLAVLVAEKLPAKAKQEFLGKFNEYIKLLKQDTESSDLYAAFVALRNSTYKHFKVRTMPSQLPDKPLAVATYKQYCSSCHGPDGGGDGILVQKTKDPRLLAPKDFKTINALGVRDAYSFFNSIYQGHKSRSMTSYKDILTSQQIWSLSFYLLSDQMRESASLRKLDRIPEQIDLEMLATYSDKDLREFFESKSIPLDSSALQWLRAELIFSVKLPRKHGI